MAALFSFGREHESKPSTLGRSGLRSMQHWFNWTSYLSGGAQPRFLTQPARRFDLPRCSDLALPIEVHN
jgi:hypothetical protein